MSEVPAHGPVGMEDPSKRRHCTLRGLPVWRLRIADRQHIPVGTRPTATPLPTLIPKRTMMNSSPQNLQHRRRMVIALISLAALALLLAVVMRVLLAP